MKLSLWSLRIPGHSKDIIKITGISQRTVVSAQKKSSGSGGHNSKKDETVLEHIQQQNLGGFYCQFENFEADVYYKV